MARSAGIFTALLLLSCGATSSALAQDFYDWNSINTLELIFTEPNWDEILDSLFLLGSEERLTGTAIINGEQFDSVGVRYKGNSSYGPDRIKNSLNVKLDYVIENQTLDGYGTLKLSNVFKDPSFVREVLSYEIARKYMCASGANFINVYINGELIGLYVSDQSVDKFFLENHFYSDDNPFFKGELVNFSPQPAIVWGYFGSDSSDYYDYYEMKSDYGWNDLINFLEVFNNDPGEMESVLDVDRLLWMLAFDILMVNLDAPVNTPHNYYLYEDATGRFNPILWDLNENFGGFTMVMGGMPINVQQMQELPPFFNMTNPLFPIINKVLPEPTYQKRYIAHLKTLIDENFSNGWYLGRALEIQNLIDADVQADPNKFYTYDEFLTNVYDQVGFGPGMIVGLAQLMEPRVAFLLNNPALQGTAPTVADIVPLPAMASPNTTVWITALVGGANLVELGHRQTFCSQFERTPMYDDGNHNDGAAGDGIYGVSVNIGSNDLHYYVYAENDEAAVFSPQRAEYEYFTVPVSADLKINEFMADNETTITDPQGEYDDWVEIWNGGDQAVNLGGMYLTDDLTEPDKWAFPDTVIEAGEFLLVWADDDEGDTGLHATFKLSASGEEIGLFRQEAGFMALLDSVIFGIQSADVSYGRYPDGSSDWFELYPTPESENMLLGQVEVEVEQPQDFVLFPAYPNPFNPTTVISYRLQVASRVKLEVFDIDGRNVVGARHAVPLRSGSSAVPMALVDGWQEAGSHKVTFDGSGLTSGVYVYRLTAGDRTAAGKTVLLK